NATPHVTQSFLGIFNVFPLSPEVESLQPYSDIFLVCRDNIRTFYGSLAYYTLPSPTIYLNDKRFSQSVIQLFLNNLYTSRTRKILAKAIDAERNKSDFTGAAELLTRLKALKLEDEHKAIIPIDTT